VSASKTSNTPDGDSTPTIWTIGHSTHSIDELIAALRAHGITRVADVRRFPGSRRYPHFNPDALGPALASAGIGYTELPGLGGRRKPRPDSPHTAWRNEAFRGYADYMDTPEFSEAAAELMQLAQHDHVAVMCAEAVWWRCHRSMIADYLKARGWTVWHIMGESAAKEHPYTPVARIVDGALTY
jgi:uncharacterized protein (DUF488 family)